MIVHITTQISFVLAVTPTDVVRTRVLMEQEIAGYNEEVDISLPTEAETATYYEPGTQLPLEEE